MLEKRFRNFFYYYYLYFLERKYVFKEVKDPSTLDKIFKIRYKVYCEEFNYLKKEDYPNKIEKDEYDIFSKHFVLIDKKTKKIIATFRLVLDSKRGIPGKNSLKMHINANELGKFAEISRFIVQKKFRGKKIMLVLIKKLYQITKKENISSLFYIIDNKLERSLLKLGFDLKRVGEFQKYQGITAPYIINISRTENKLKKKDNFLSRYILN